MTARADLKLTADDYRTLPEGGPQYQLVEGELFMTPAPSFQHADVVTVLSSALHVFASANRLGKVVVAPVDVFLGKHDVYQPDILFVAAAHADRIEKDGVHGAPDLVVEVLSPSTRRLDLAVKRARYAAAGVVEAWFVDLDMDEVLVNRLQEKASDPAQILRRGATLESDLLPGFMIAVDAVIEAK